MRRREFLRTAGIGMAALSLPGARARSATWALVPMDDAQTDHLKAYGLTFRALERGERAEWLLNYRGGAFLLPGGLATTRDAALSGVALEPIGDGAVTDIRAEIQQANMDAIPLEKAPRVAVYAPPNASPWDDAVTMALVYAGIRFEKVWDAEMLGRGLAGHDWLHLHHEDFTGQYSKFYLNYAGAPWLVDMVQRNQAMAKQLGFPSVPAAKRAVARRIREFVDGGGFVFAMCTATETLDLALASGATDIAASYADGTPMDPDAGSRMDWAQSLAFQGARLEQSPTV
ncbi:MAG: asparagine synthetase B, partial [Gemmatimonadota bacterium]|nr:asparagine synthetase B [Gemmatimonadota bacterium]